MVHSWCGDVRINSLHTFLSFGELEFIVGGIDLLLSLPFLIPVFSFRGPCGSILSRAFNELFHLDYLNSIFTFQNSLFSNYKERKKYTFLFLLFQESQPFIIQILQKVTPLHSYNTFKKSQHFITKILWKSLNTLKSQYFWRVTTIHNYDPSQGSHHFNIIDNFSKSCFLIFFILLSSSIFPFWTPLFSSPFFVLSKINSPPFNILILRSHVYLLNISWLFIRFS